MLAIFDLLVGVSNDAVNFMNSAVGAKVARYRTIIIVAAVGVFAGAILSNGMMDIARHGIFQPANFSFYEIMCILLAVMVTDVVLLDVFNTLGLPTSTTVSMVFELLGGTFILAILKIIGDETGLLSLGDMMNTEKHCPLSWVSSSLSLSHLLPELLFSIYPESFSVSTIKNIFPGQLDIRRNFSHITFILRSDQRLEKCTVYEY